MKLCKKKILSKYKSKEAEVGKRFMYFYECRLMMCCNVSNIRENDRSYYKTRNIDLNT